MPPKPDSSVRQRFKAPSATSTPSKAPSKPIPKKQPYGKPADPPYHVEPIIAFYLFFASNIVAALFSPIQDCDEVFNYWEPTHYLVHGHGFQTWEYSPEFALRSWTYTCLHAVVSFFIKIAPFFGGRKNMEFYGIRIALGFVCAVCETKLFTKIANSLNPRIAVTFLIIMVSSPGMFHASVAYLPSSFAMYFVMLGTASFMDWRGGMRTAQAIMCYGIGATLGWPFCAALAIPFLAEELLMASLGDDEGRIQLFWRIADGVVRTIVVMIVQWFVDWNGYKEVFYVPFNMIWYNVFSGGKGPALYGTEPWHFYARNLFLNFHVWFLLALLSIPLLLIQHIAKGKGTTKSSYFRGLVFLSPFYLWLTVFTLQAHKEERFMYPAYPALALNAGVALHIILANIGSTDPKTVVSKIPVQLRFLTVFSFMVAALAFSVFRTVGTMTAFSAPLSIYKPLHDPGMIREGDTVCLSKEWYRFPSHYLLPDNIQAKFVKSEFSGLLPGEFSQANMGFGIFPGTWLIPSGMNDENREDVGKYTDIKHCTYLVDSNMPSTEATKLEPDYIADSMHWEKVQCLPFMDAASTNIIGRLGWVPDLPFIPAKFRRVYGDYCLLRRKTAAEAKDSVMDMPRIETMQ